jgi:hypothetical protein
MKTLNSLKQKSLVGVIVLLFAFFTNAALATTVVPQFNLTGIWSNPVGGATVVFQEGTEVTFVSVDPFYAHYYVGRYISPTVVQGIQHRVNRANGCATEMLFTLRATNNNNIAAGGRALDSRCDITVGTTFSGSSSRLQ